MPTNSRRLRRRHWIVIAGWEFMFPLPACLCSPQPSSSDVSVVVVVWNHELSPRGAMSANQDPDFNARRNNISQLLVVHVCRRDREGDRAGRKAVLLLQHTPSIGLTLERASHDTSLHGGIHVFATWRANGNTTINFQLCTAAFYYHHAKTQGSKRRRRLCNKRGDWQRSIYVGWPWKTRVLWWCGWRWMRIEERWVHYNRGGLIVMQSDVSTVFGVLM